MTQKPGAFSHLLFKWKQISIFKFLKFQVKKKETKILTFGFLRATFCYFLKKKQYKISQRRHVNTSFINT